MPSNAPPSPFPFLPVVLESPSGAQARTLTAGGGTARSPGKATRQLSRAKGRAACRSAAGAIQSVPGLTLNEETEALRVEVVRRIDPAWVMLLGAIVR